MASIDLMGQLKDQLMSADFAKNSQDVLHMAGEKDDDESFEVLRFPSHDNKSLDTLLAEHDKLSGMAVNNLNQPGTTMLKSPSKDVPASKTTKPSTTSTFLNQKKPPTDPKQPPQKEVSRSQDKPSPAAAVRPKEPVNTSTDSSAMNEQKAKYIKHLLDQSLGVKLGDTMYKISGHIRNAMSALLMAVPYDHVTNMFNQVVTIIQTAVNADRTMKTGDLIGKLSNVPQQVGDISQTLATLVDAISQLSMAHSKEHTVPMSRKTFIYFMRTIEIDDKKTILNETNILTLWDARTMTADRVDALLSIKPGPERKALLSTWVREAHQLLVEMRSHAGST